MTAKMTATAANVGTHKRTAVDDSPVIDTEALTAREIAPKGGDMTTQSTLIAGSVPRARSGAVELYKGRVIPLAPLSQQCRVVQSLPASSSLRCW
jgi:hypothetical protein